MNDVALCSPRVLGLCAGIGGLELGLKLAIPGSRLVGIVERDAYCAAVLVARMEDKALDQAPVWDDLATFDGAPWRGAVDIVTSGFPCQPISSAGKRLGTDDERWLWPEIVRVIRDVGPRIIFLENVPTLITGGFAGDILGDLAELGRVGRAAIHHPHFQKLKANANRRETLVRPNSASESSSWPTPAASSPNDGEMPATWLARRDRVAQERRDRGESGSNGLPLAIAAQLWSTPTASEGMSGPGLHTARGTPSNLRTQVLTAGPQDRATPKDGRNTTVLNPWFVEALMGFPPGWSACTPLVTASYLRWQQQHSSVLQDALAS